MTTAVVFPERLPVPELEQAEAEKREAEMDLQEKVRSLDGLDQQRRIIGNRLEELQHQQAECEQTAALEVLIGNVEPKKAVTGLRDIRQQREGLELATKYYPRLRAERLFKVAEARVRHRVAEITYLQSKARAIEAEAIRRLQEAGLQTPLQLTLPEAEGLYAQSGQLSASLHGLQTQRDEALRAYKTMSGDRDGRP